MKNRASYSTLILGLFLYFLLLKITAYLIIAQTGNQFFGGGNDSDYYDAYATGKDDFAVNIWPIFLYHLNELGLYSRRGTSIALALIGFIAIPLMCAKAATYQDDNQLPANRVYWLTAAYTSFYPTVIYYTTDIYRDVAMLFIFLIGLIVFQQRNENILLKIASLALISVILYAFRPYLGFAFAFTLIAHIAGLTKQMTTFKGVLIILILLNLLHWLGALSPLTTYRNIFLTEMTGGSNLGILFDSPQRFMLDFLNSVLLQIFGLHFVNASTIIAFLAESVPFTVCLIYTLKNRRFWNTTIHFLLAFCIVYGCLWTIGNDNLGTAVRLRIFNYTAVTICAFIILHYKLSKKHDNYSNHIKSSLLTSKL